MGWCRGSPQARHPSTCARCHGMCGALRVARLDAGHCNMRSCMQPPRPGATAAAGAPAHLRFAAIDALSEVLHLALILVALILVLPQVLLRLLDRGLQCIALQATAAA